MAVDVCMRDRSHARTRDTAMKGVTCEGSRVLEGSTSRVFIVQRMVLNRISRTKHRGAFAIKLKFLHPPAEKKRD